MVRRIAWSGLRRSLLVVGFGAAGVMGIRLAQAQELCGGVDYPFPYTDVSGVGAAFCPGIMEAYVTAVTKGTTPTTFSPDDNVSRLQMTTFLQRTLDQWWPGPQTTAQMQFVTVGSLPFACAARRAVWQGAR